MNQTPFDVAPLVWLTDSRQVVQPEQAVFWAITGVRHNGHDYVATLYKRGVRRFVVEQSALTPARSGTFSALTNAQFRVVDNALHEIQREAARQRSDFNGSVVGITGSNGKTIVKEWLATLLSPDVNVVRSPKSYNSQLGVALSVHQLRPDADVALIEAGISQPDEMQALAEMIRPTLGIFTNIGPAHDEGFRSRRQKVAEKLRLFTQAETLVYCRDHADVDAEVHLVLKAVNPTLRLIHWSWRPDAKAVYYVQRTENQLTLTAEHGQWTYDVPFTDPASVENIVHCVVTLHTLGLVETATARRPGAPHGEASADRLQTRLARLRPVSMRLEVKEGLNGCVLIDDSYNNDLAGLQLALHFQQQQAAGKPKVVILSDLLQTGQPPADLYADVARLLADQHVAHFIGIGLRMRAFASLFPAGSQFFETTPAFLAQFPMASLRDAVVLVKGARSFGFEEIVRQLQRRVHGTVLEINLDALTHNLNTYRALVGPQTKIMVMVKAFAYGSGSAEVARWLQFHRVDYLAVAYADEGIALRQSGIDRPIMVMNPAPDTFEALITYQLEPEIYSLTLLDAWEEFLGVRQRAESGGLGVESSTTLSPKPAAPRSPHSALRPTPLALAPPPLHLKIDTGMHRLGFLPDEIPALAERLATSGLNVASVFSHLVGADDATHNAFSEEQHRRFMAALAPLEQALGYRPLRHLLNSAGIRRFPDYRLDMVRLGIGLYGVDSSGLSPDSVQPVGTLRSVVSQVKRVSAGDTVGYSRRGTLAQDAEIATIAIGYADGYDRRLGNGAGYVLINGHRCPTVGNVCMDMTMVDATGAGAREGDVVEVFGPNVPITELARVMGTIPYEILTGVSERVKRVFYKEGN